MAVTGETDPITGIRVLAAELIDEAAFDGPPFHPAVLASFQNVREIRPKPMQSAARLVPDPATRTLVIEVNEDHSQGKRNFSINHETSHTLIPTYSGRLIDDLVTGQFAASSEEELLCDVGASALLLDDRWLRPLAQEAGPSLSTLFSLAELFDASLEATARKLAELDIWPCAFVFWEGDFRKSERISSSQMMMPFLEPLGTPKPKFRVKRPYVSQGFEIYIPENKSVDDTSLVATCCDSDLITFGTELFDLGSFQGVLYCENAYVPYRSAGVVHRRVLSLLIRTQMKRSDFVIHDMFSLENL